jgi:hypothetical protein
MVVDGRDEYDRILEDKAEYPRGFLEGLNELEYQLCHYILLFSDFLIISISKIFRDHSLHMSSVRPEYEPC